MSKRVWLSVFFVVAAFVVAIWLLARGSIKVWRPPHRHYTVTDLGTLAGPLGDFSVATGINDSDQVVGYSHLINPQITHAFIWQAGAMQDLGSFENEREVLAAGINNSGSVVGSSSHNPNCPCRAFIWAGGALKDAGQLPGFTDGGAVAINTSGQIAGSSFNRGFGGQPCPYYAYKNTGGNFTDLGAIGGTGGYARAINTSGHVAGWACLRHDSAHSRAFLYTAGLMFDLGTLGGASSDAYGVNDAGVVVGGSNDANGAWHAFMYKDGVMTDLGALDGHSSNANAINNAGHVVGTSGDPSGAPGNHAFIAFGGGIWDLNNLIPENSGWVLQSALAINSAGHIVGFGITNNKTHAFLLIPSD